MLRACARVASVYLHPLACILKPCAMRTSEQNNNKKTRGRGIIVTAVSKWHAWVLACALMCTRSSAIHSRQRRREDDAVQRGQAVVIKPQGSVGAKGTLDISACDEKERGERDKATPHVYRHASDTKMDKRVSVQQVGHGIRDTRCPQDPQAACRQTRMHYNEHT